MSKSIATTQPRFRFGNIHEPTINDVTAVREDSSSSMALKLLILFLIIMYSSIGALVPSVEVVRPAMTVAIGAVLFTLIEVTKKGPVSNCPGLRAG